MSVRIPVRLGLVLAALTLAPALAAQAAMATDQDQVVAIGNFTFDPPTLMVPAGTQVTWVNHDDIPHTATGADGGFGSPVLDTDERFSFRFDQPGTYAYFCKLHPHMSGTIRVTPKG